MKSTTLSLLLTRVIRAPRTRVFNAFGSIEELKKWFGPEECRVVSGELDFRTGGAYRLEMHTSSFGAVELFGTYLEVVPDARLRLTWAWRNHPIPAGWGQMTVNIEFAEHRDGTLVTISHEGLLNEQVREGHQHGWNGSFDKLTGYCGAA